MSQQGCGNFPRYKKERQMAEKKRVRTAAKPVEKKPSGRPREHDRESIVLELIEWAKLPDSINLNGFCCTREPPLSPSFITRWAKECAIFRQAYEAAKAFIGIRREIMLSNQTLHVKAYDLNAKVYDHFLKEERQEEMIFESKINSEKAEVSKDLVDQFSAIMLQVASLQAKHRDRKISDSNINPDT